MELGLCRLRNSWSFLILSTLLGLRLFGLGEGSLQWKLGECEKKISNVKDDQLVALIFTNLRTNYDALFSMICAS